MKITPPPERFPTSGNDRNNNKFVILACPESLFIGEGYFRVNDGKSNVLLLMVFLVIL